METQDDVALLLIAAMPKRSPTLTPQDRAGLVMHGLVFTYLRRLLKPRDHLVGARVIAPVVAATEHVRCRWPGLAAELQANALPEFVGDSGRVPDSVAATYAAYRWWLVHVFDRALTQAAAETRTCRFEGGVEARTRWERFQATRDGAIAESWRQLSQRFSFVREESLERAMGRAVGAAGVSDVADEDVDDVTAELTTRRLAGGVPMSLFLGRDGGFHLDERAVRDVAASVRDMHRVRRELGTHDPITGQVTRKQRRVRIEGATSLCSVPRTEPVAELLSPQDEAECAELVRAVQDARHELTEAADCAAYDVLRGDGTRAECAARYGVTTNQLDYAREPLVRRLRARLGAYKGATG